MNKYQKQFNKIKSDFTKTVVNDIATIFSTTPPAKRIDNLDNYVDIFRTLSEDIESCDEISQMIEKSYPDINFASYYASHIRERLEKLFLLS